MPSHPMADHGDMTQERLIVLHARLEVRQDHVSGEVRREGQPAVDFSGWIGLLGAVEQACQAAGCDEVIELSPPAELP